MANAAFICLNIPSQNCHGGGWVGFQRLVECTDEQIMTMNVSFPIPILWCCRGENLGTPEWSASAFKTWDLHCYCNRMAARFLGHSIFPLLKEKQNWSAQDMDPSFPNFVSSHTHRCVEAQGKGWQGLIHTWRLLLHPRPVRDSWLVLHALMLHRTRNPSSTEVLHLPNAEIL